jgi:hypothetical protein
LLTHVLTYLTSQPSGLIIADQFIKGYNKELAYSNGCAPLFADAGGVLVYNPEIGKMVGEGIVLYLFALVIRAIIVALFFPLLQRCAAQRSPSTKRCRTCYIGSQVLLHVHVHVLTDSCSCSCSCAYNLCTHGDRLGYGITWQGAVVATWGGLRGAVGLALAIVMQSELHVQCHLADLLNMHETKEECAARAISTERDGERPTPTTTLNPSPEPEPYPEPKPKPKTGMRKKI